MVARLEIEQLGDAASEKQITDAVKALNGVTDVKVEKDALFVTYDPLITTEKKIEAAVRLAEVPLKLREQIPRDHTPVADFWPSTGRRSAKGFKRPFRPSRRNQQAGSLCSPEFAAGTAAATATTPSNKPRLRLR